MAAYGIIGLQTLLPLVLKAGLTTRDIIKKLALEPRKILGLALPKIAEGESADLVLFDPKARWVFDEQTNASKSANSPFMGHEFTGQVRWACANNQYYTLKN